MKGMFRNLFGWCRKKDISPLTPPTSSSSSVKISPKSVKISNTKKSKSNKHEYKNKYVDLRAEWKFSKSTKSQLSPTTNDPPVSDDISLPQYESSFNASSSTTEDSSVTSPIKTSALRKLNISELSCKKKSSSKHSIRSNTSTTSRHESSLMESVREDEDLEVTVNIACVCGNNQMTSSFVIQCDHCGLWFHTDCVRLSETCIEELERRSWTGSATNASRRPRTTQT